MLFDPAFYLVAVPAVAFAGVSKGGFGASAGFAAAAIPALVIEPGFAVGMMLPLLMVMDVASLRPYWRRWSGRDAKVLILGAIPGILLGAALWRVANDDAIRLMIGTISIAFVAWQVARARGLARVGRERVPAWGGVVAGLVAGFTSFVSHAGGPPVGVYLLAKRLEKTVFQATTVLTFWAINLAKVVPYAFLGIFTAETLAASGGLAPVGIGGVWLGVRAHRIVPEGPFFAVTYALLTLTGLKLIWDALT